jgi:glycosyltransferase involved in cell wall biosynthesis
MAAAPRAEIEAVIGGTARDASTITVAFVLEQHLGHRTYAENLEAAVAGQTDLHAVVVPVRYADAGSWAERVPMPGSVRSVLRARAEMRRPLAAVRADVHVFNTQVPAVIGPHRARAVPYVVVTDVTPVQYDRMAEGYAHRPDRGVARAVKHAWNRHVLRGAAHAVAWSSWARASYTDDYGIAPERTSVIPPGVDTVRYAPGSTDRHGPVRILFVGADFARKGGHQLLEAVASLPAGTNAHVELVLVTRTFDARTGGPLGATVRVVDDLVPNDARLVQLFRDSDVFVLPSRSETFGIAAVEASACGLPTIATAVGGLTDIVADGLTGITVPPGDVAALTTAVRTLVGEPELRRRYGAAARARAVERFDARANAARLLDVVRRSADT